MRAACSGSPGVDWKKARRVHSGVGRGGVAGGGGWTWREERRTKEGGRAKKRKGRWGSAPPGADDRGGGDPPRPRERSSAIGLVRLGGEGHEVDRHRHEKEGEHHV